MKPLNTEIIANEISRRHFLNRGGSGIGLAALASLIDPGPLFAETKPHRAPRAKRIIWLTQAGAPSQIDLFDYKPGLASQFDKDLPDSIRSGQRLTGMSGNQSSIPLAASPFAFARHGQSGESVSQGCCLCTARPNRRLNGFSASYHRCRRLIFCLTQ